MLIRDRQHLPFLVKRTSLSLRCHSHTVGGFLRKGSLSPESPTSMSHQLARHRLPSGWYARSELFQGGKSGIERFLLSGQLLRERLDVLAGLQGCHRNGPEALEA